jgi:hypothetical protein
VLKVIPALKVQQVHKVHKAQLVHKVHKAL